MYALVANIGWLKYYQGCDYDGEYERPYNGGSYNIEHEGWESENFVNYDGYCYGCFNLPNSGDIMHLKRNFGLENEENELDGVTIIFVADATGTGVLTGKRIVGWYENATVFRELQEDDDFRRYYRGVNAVSTSSSDSTMTQTSADSAVLKV